MNRRACAIVSLGLCGAVLEPLVRDPDDDGFPLSTYPMFAMPRPPELTMAYAAGATGDGRLRSLSPAQLGTGEVMQAFTTLQRAAGAGPGERGALCAAVARRVAGDADYRDVIEIRIMGATYDAVERIAHGAPASREAILARCDVAGSRR
jgi:hypothetical protein